VVPSARSGVATSADVKVIGGREHRSASRRASTRAFKEGALTCPQLGARALRNLTLKLKFPTRSGQRLATWDIRWEQHLSCQSRLTHRLI
jgi:hypothetical protein